MPPANNKQIVILGWYGSDNTGDEAVLQAVVEALQARGFSHLHVLSTAPEKTARKLGVTSSPRTPVAESIRAVRDADALILGGGGLIQDGTSVYNLPIYALYVALARLFGLKVICWGLGVEPLWTRFGNWLARFIVRSSHHFSVRDGISKGILAKAGVPAPLLKITADPAFLTKPGRIAEPEPRSRPLVVFCLRHLSDNHPGINLHYLLPVSLRKKFGLGWRPPPERNSRFIEGIARGIRVCTGEIGADVALLPLWPGRDDPLLDEVEAEVERQGAVSGQVHRADVDTDPSSIAAYIAQADLLVSMRLHALIFGAAEGVPLLAVSYAHKVRGLMRLLGMERWVIEVETRTPPVEELEMKLRLLWGMRDEESGKVRPRAETLKVRAAEDANIIASLLGGSK